MNCFVAQKDQLFDQLLFAIVPPRAVAFKSEDPPASLFDLPPEVPRWGRIEFVNRFDEDAERWDGLA